jgi:uncharacterized protein (DUF1330 family)
VDLVLVQATLSEPMFPLAGPIPSRIAPNKNKKEMIWSLARRSDWEIPGSPFQTDIDQRGWTDHTEETMAKAYWVVCYRSISDPAARDKYTKLAVPAVLASGGRFLARGNPAKTYEGGINQRTVLVEFDSLAQAIAAHDSPAYQSALAVLGNAAERDLRIIEGV